MKQSIIVIFLLIIIVVSVQADGPHPRGIILDRTIGSAVKPDLFGPHYEINAENTDTNSNSYGTGKGGRRYT